MNEKESAFDLAIRWIYMLHGDGVVPADEDRREDGQPLCDEDSQLKEQGKREDA